MSVTVAAPLPATASPLAPLFAALTSRLGGDVEPLPDEAIARIVEQARAGDTGARLHLYEQFVNRVFRAVRGILRSDVTATGEMPDVAGPDRDPVDELDRDRQRRALLVALAELPERERAIVSLRDGADLNASEIAGTMALEPATVRKMLERTRAQLGERIDALSGAVGGLR